jgi:hypothetical protein
MKSPIRIVKFLKKTMQNCKNSEFEENVRLTIRDFTHTTMQLKYSQPDFYQVFENLTSTLALKIVKWHEKECDDLRGEINELKKNRQEEYRVDSPRKRKKMEPVEESEPITEIPQESEKPKIELENKLEDKNLDQMDSAPSSQEPETFENESNESTLPNPQRVQWKLDEILLLIKCRNENLSWRDICLRFPTRTRTSVKSHWFTSVSDGRIVYNDGVYSLPGVKSTVTIPLVVPSSTQLQLPPLTPKPIMTPEEFAMALMKSGNIKSTIPIPIPPPPPTITVPRTIAPEPEKKKWAREDYSLMSRLKKIYGKDAKAEWLHAFPGRSIADILKVYDMID